VRVSLPSPPPVRAVTRRASAGPLLDMLAEADLVGDVTGDPGQVLRDVTKRLRQYRLGDTLVYLTGPARLDDLAMVGSLRAGYPTIVAGVFGDPAVVPSTLEHLHLLTIPDAVAFARAWDGVGW
jgi:hypothetical protein